MTMQKLHFFIQYLDLQKELSSSTTVEAFSIQYTKEIYLTRELYHLLE